MTGNFSIIKFNEWEFVNHYWETSNAWGHECHLLKNGSEMSKARARYYNRTWEKYTYQSVMFEAVDNARKDHLDHYIEAYKANNDIERFKAGQKKQLEEQFDKEYPIYNELETFVKER